MSPRRERLLRRPKARTRRPGSVQSHCRCEWAWEDQGNLLTSQGGSKSGHFHTGTARKHKAGWWSRAWGRESVLCREARSAGCQPGPGARCPGPLLRCGTPLVLSASKVETGGPTRPASPGRAGHAPELCKQPEGPGETERGPQLGSTGIRLSLSPGLHWELEGGSRPSWMQ